MYCELYRLQQISMEGATLQADLSDLIMGGQSLQLCELWVYESRETLVMVMALIGLIDYITVSISIPSTCGQFVLLDFVLIACDGMEYA